MAAAFIAALLIEHAAWPGGGEAGLTGAEDGVRTFAAQQWCARHLAGQVLALNDALSLAKLNRKKVRALRTSRGVCVAACALTLAFARRATRPRGSWGWTWIPTATSGAWATCAPSRASTAPATEWSTPGQERPSWFLFVFFFFFLNIFLK